MSQSSSLSEKSVYISGGTSFSGTGDIRGFYTSTSVQKSIKKWNYGLELSTNMFDKEKPLYYQIGSGPLVNSSIRSMLAGVQLAAIISNSFIKDEKENLSFGLGTLVRYQSNSIYDLYIIHYPNGTMGFGYPVISIVNSSPMRTLAIGGMAKLAYQFFFEKKWAAGACVSFQLDSNGDTFFNKGLTLAYKL